MTITADTPQLFDERTWEARAVTNTTHPDTSLEAAMGVDKAGSQLAVLRVLARSRTPMADREIHVCITRYPQEFSGGKQYTDSRVRTARVELAREGLVEEVEGVKVQTSIRGRGRTWRITLAGRLHLMDNA